MVRDSGRVAVLESRRILRLAMPVRRIAGTAEPGGAPCRHTAIAHPVQRSFAVVAIKYIIFLVLFGVSLSALATAEKAAEVEPFKTAIILHFARSWPFLLYVGAILAASLTVERVFCRYLCPLGAALALPARLRMFDWLRRCANAATLASAAATNARCRPSIPKATSIRTNASSVCTVRCSITTINCAR